MMWFFAILIVLAMGAIAAHDSAEAKWPVQADVVIESVGPATWEQSVRSLKAGGRMVVCGGTSGPKVELNLPRLFFKQFEIIGSSMGSYQEFEQLTPSGVDPEQWKADLKDVKDKLTETCRAVDYMPAVDPINEVNFRCRCRRALS